MEFERTRDFGLVREIATHPLIYPAISDDFSPSPEDWQPSQAECVFYLLVKDAGEVLGMFALYQKNAICWDVHTCLLPKAWGERARIAAREAVRWVFDNTQCVRLITDVPEYNRLAFRFALDAGMKLFGRNRLSYMKDGQLHDVLMLGISKCLL